jgi:APA family basic amino acid/polyamine antiporter
MKPERTNTLERAIRLPHATAMVVGTIIGTSIFVQPSEVTGQVPSVAGVFAVWIVCGVLTLFGALVCAELASIFTRSGGVYVYLKEAFSPALGFLWGWAMFWTMHSGIIAAIAVVCGRYTAYFVPMGDNGVKAVGIGAILILTAINYVGVRQGSTLQTAFTAGKLIAIVLIIVSGFAFGGAAHEQATGGTQQAGSQPAATSIAPAGAAPEGAPAPGQGLAEPGSPTRPAGSGAGGAGFTEFLLALVAGLFAFGGWHMVTYNSEETVDPRTTIPRALVIGVGVVTACYVAMNAVYMWVLPLDTIRDSTRVAADAADAVWGTGGGSMMSGLVIFSAFGALAGIVLAGPRVYYAMAQDGLLFRWAAAVHPRYHTPHRAIVMQGVWSCVLVATGTYRALFTRVIYTEWIFFGLMALGLIVLRRRDALHQAAASSTANAEQPPESTASFREGSDPSLDRTGRPYRADYRMWGYPVVPLVFALSAFAIVINQVISSPVESLTGLSLVLIGLPVYYLWARHRPAAYAAGDAATPADEATDEHAADAVPTVPNQE